MGKSMKIFEKTAFGYRIDDVDNYIEDLNRQIATLEAEKDELMAKMRVLAEKINEYRKEETDLKDALLGAQKMGNTIINEAKAKADMMIADATTRAERLVYDSKKQADEAISAIHKQVEKEKMALVKMQKEVSDFKSTLLSTYKRHLNLITALPEIEEETKDDDQKTEDTASEVLKTAETLEIAEEVDETEEVSEEVEEIEEEENEDVSTVRFDKVANEEKPNFVPARKSSFEEKFGELKFGRNNNN